MKPVKYDRGTDEVTNAPYDSQWCCADDVDAALDAERETVRALTESRDAWKLSQETAEKAYLAIVNQIPADRFDYDPANIALLDGAKQQEEIGRKQITDLQTALDAERARVTELEAHVRLETLEYGICEDCPATYAHCQSLRAQGKLACCPECRHLATSDAPPQPCDPDRGRKDDRDKLVDLVGALRQALTDIRDAVLHGRHQLEGMEIDNDVTNAVLGIIDDHTPTQAVTPDAREGA